MWVLKLDKENHLMQMINLNLTSKLLKELFKVTKILSIKAFMMINALLNEHCSST